MNKENSEKDIHKFPQSVSLHLFTELFVLMSEKTSLRNSSVNKSPKITCEFCVYIKPFIEHSTNCVTRMYLHDIYIGVGNPVEIHFRITQMVECSTKDCLYSFT